MRSSVWRLHTHEARACASVDAAYFRLRRARACDAAPVREEPPSGRNAGMAALTIMQIAMTPRPLGWTHENPRRRVSSLRVHCRQRFEMGIVITQSAYKVARENCLACGNHRSFASVFINRRGLQQ